MRRNHLIPITNHCWLVVSNYPSEKYEFVSWDNDIPNWKVIIHSCSKAPAIKRRACLPSFNQLVIRIFILEVSQIVFLPIPVPDSSFADQADQLRSPKAHFPSSARQIFAVPSWEAVNTNLWSFTCGEAANLREISTVDVCPFFDSTNGD